MSELYRAIAGSPITYLATDVSAGQTTIAVTDDSVLPDAPNICTIGYGEHIETIRYGAKSNGVLQDVTRGIEGTPRAWQSGTEVARFYTAYEHNAIVETIKSHLAESARKHITESGSNENGYYIKFDDGTMICVNQKVIRGSDFVELKGNTNVSGIRLSRLASQQYPATFTKCFYSDFKILGSTSVAMRSNVIGTKVEYAINSLASSNTQWRNPAIFHISESIDSSDETLFAFIAIGRWK